MLSQVFILSSKGDPLVLKDFRGDACGDVTDAFYRGVTSLRGDQAPVFMAREGWHFVHVRHGGLYVGATARPGASPFTLVEFLNRLVTLLREHCGTLTERSLGLNLGLVYELLDEMVDFGYVQSTAPEVLRSLTQGEPAAPRPFSLLDLGSVGLFGAETQQSRVAPSTAPNRPVLPPRGEQGGRSELFVDVVERLTVVIAANGTPLKVDVQGEIRLKSFLPGACELRLGLTEELSLGTDEQRGYGRLPLASCSFHSSVDLEEFERGRVLKVTPGPGEVTLMRYQLAEDVPVPLPFRLGASVEWEPTGRLRIHLKLRCDLPPKNYAINVRLQLPVPKGASSLAQELSSPEQTAELEGGGRCLRWDVPRCQGGSQLGAVFKLGVPGGRRAALPVLGPAALSFEVPALTCSGLRLRCLRLHGPPAAPPGPPQRWVRHLTHSDSYVLRL